VSIFETAFASTHRRSSAVSKSCGGGLSCVPWLSAFFYSRSRARLTGESTGDPRAQAEVIRARPLPNVDIDETVETGHEDLSAAFIPTWL
jgi:hypothetical protein